MPSSGSITNITPPRVPLIDQRTGLISREWYRFFLNLFQLTGAGTNAVSLTDLQLAPPSVSVEAIQTDPNALDNNPTAAALVSQVAEIDKQLQAILLQPQFDVGAILTAIKSLSSAPVTKTANFTVADNETWLINNKTGSSCTVTLPAVASNLGRELHFQNYQAQTLVSASSNVVPLAGGATSTAILEAVAGANCTLVSDGTNWIMTQYDSNNALQLE